MTRDQLFTRLSAENRILVPSHMCSAKAIEDAKSSDCFYQDATGLGFIMEKSDRKRPTPKKAASKKE